MMHTTVPGAARKPMSLTLDETLLITAKALRVNISQAAEAGLARAVAERRAAQWLEEGSGALDS